MQYVLRDVMKLSGSSEGDMTIAKTFIKELKEESVNCEDIISKIDSGNELFTYELLLKSAEALARLRQLTEISAVIANQHSLETSNLHKGFLNLHNDIRSVTNTCNKKFEAIRGYYPL